LREGQAGLVTHVFDNTLVLLEYSVGLGTSGEEESNMRSQVRRSRGIAVAVLCLFFGLAAGYFIGSALTLNGAREFVLALNAEASGSYDEAKEYAKVGLLCLPFWARDMRPRCLVQRALYAKFGEQYGQGPEDVDRLLRTAIKTDPDCAEAHFWLASLSDDPSIRKSHGLRVLKARGCTLSSILPRSHKIVLHEWAEHHDTAVEEAQALLGRSLEELVTLGPVLAQALEGREDKRSADLVRAWQAGFSRLQNEVNGWALYYWVAKPD